MSEYITSSVIGRLNQGIASDVDWYSEPIPIPLLLNQKLSIAFEVERDPSFINEADSALTHFLAFGQNERKSLSTYIYHNCMEFIEAVGDEDWNEPMRLIKEKVDIWQFVHPQQIIVSRRPDRDMDIYVSLMCECGWEVEHGLQLVFRKGKQLTRISSQDGHLTEADAYDKPDEEDELLCQFVDE